MTGQPQQPFQQLLTQFKSSDDHISELNQSLEKIEKILYVVRDISTKTDLLSLNASIEAVRAGQSGKGFAVVADEVARLAEKTQESISEIESAFDLFKEEFSGLKNSLDKTKGLFREINENCAHKSKEEQGYHSNQ
jgi:methyl-accepting chemotaxis protein